MFGLDPRNLNTSASSRDRPKDLMYSCVNSELESVVRSHVPVVKKRFKFFSKNCIAYPMKLAHKCAVFTSGVV